MKRRNREINIFSTSALDLFASAMGAFMLISLIALPYYLNRDELHDMVEQLTQQVSQLSQQVEDLTQQNQQLQDALAQAQQDLQRSQSRNQELERQVGRMREQLSKTYLVVIASWPTTADVDLHVNTPSGNHYYWEKPNRPPRPGAPRPDYREDAELSFDANAGRYSDGGIEVWQMIDAVPGQYRVRLSKFKPNLDSSPTTVEVTILYRDGTHRVTIPGLSRKDLIDIATITVDREGNVTVQNR